MKFPENWLREQVDIRIDRAGLVHGLTMAGLEVEAVTPLGDGLANVVVGEIIEAVQHPNADRLRVCRVKAGDAELQIVCGAPNARAGLKAPLARVGAMLPNGMQIKAAALRGVDSQGMLCSARELGLSEDADGLMELPADAPTGASLADYLGLPDATLELKLTPNRADCFGILGLAYDAAALFGGSARVPEFKPVPPSMDAAPRVRLEAGADCPRYLGRILRGVNTGAATPLWMRERLRRSGLRPISAVVDVTNYVMLELGQPLHAFDAGSIDGDIVVRHARAGERIKLLDEREVELDPGFLMIADDAKGLALAGVMGGFESRVTDATRDILLEAAHFAPSAIMGRGRKLGMHTDAGHRFERGVDPELPRHAMERATALILEIAGGEAGPICEAVNASGLPVRKPVLLRRERLARVLGIRLADSEVERILVALGMRVDGDAQGWIVHPPSRRFDIEIEEDLIEEVVRIHGYEKVPTLAPAGELPAPHLAEQVIPSARVRDRLLARGYQEAITYAFVDAGLLERWGMQGQGIALANPLSRELAVMRPSLLPGLVQALLFNRHRQHTRVRLCEIGHVFDAAGAERNMLGVVACGAAHAEQWGSPRRALDFFDLKGDIESLLGLAGPREGLRFEQAGLAWLHPGRSARICDSEGEIGVLGALHPSLTRALDLKEDVYVAELSLERVAGRGLPRAAALSAFPSLRRDLALVLPDAVAFEAVRERARAALGVLGRDVFVFDVYTGPGLEPGFKSLAIGLILQDASRTLTDQDADRCTQVVLDVLQRDLGARLRG